MTTHLSEEELIGYQLGETHATASVARHLEQCAVCAAAAESIAETLRVFSGERVPEANVEHAWQRLRGSLPSLPSESARRAGRWYRPLAWMGAAALLVVLGFMGVRVQHGTGAGVLRSSQSTPRVQAGPLTTEPQDVRVAAHLDDAERLLTEMDHAAGPLDAGTRERATELLLTNAMYVQRARRDGDVAEASVLEELGRALTTVEHAPARPREGWKVRMEMNTGGLLLDIRILQQNDSETVSKDRP